MNNELKNIITEFCSSNLSKLKYKNGDFEVELEKESSYNLNEKQIKESNDNNAIISPVVGKFHKSNVSIGSFVKKGEPLCIIETMKTFNEITADGDYIIEDILVTEGSSIECNQKLMLVSKK